MEWNFWSWSQNTKCQMYYVQPDFSKNRSLYRVFNFKKVDFFSHVPHTVGLNMCVTLKKCPHKPNIFLIPLNISELTSSQNFFVTVWSPGGVIIAFAENWNFELKFFLWILLGKKWLLGNFGSIFCPKMSLKCPKTRLFCSAFSY